MQWTAEKPTEPGVYWVRTDDEPAPTAVIVGRVSAESPMAVEFFGTEEAVYLAPVSVNSVVGPDWLWLGPVTPEMCMR